METFYKKNDIGVSIEYTIVGRYSEDNTNYIIYTNFVDDNDSPTQLKLFASILDNGRMIDVDYDKRNEIIDKMFQEILASAGL